MSCVECGDPITAADRKYSGPCTHCGALTCDSTVGFVHVEARVLRARRGVKAQSLEDARDAMGDAVGVLVRVHPGDPTGVYGVDRPPAGGAH